jgi:hypothetical protein
VQRLLGVGYFPVELPPPFTTAGFAALVAGDAELPLKAHGDTLTAQPMEHNLARFGFVRRTLGIPNPLLQARLAQTVAKRWDDLIGLCKSRLSVNHPVARADGPRAIERSALPGSMASARAAKLATSRFVLRTDVLRFYPSIYSHSLAWAIHGKEEAKRNRADKTLLGNLIDRRVRAGQDGQTMGIPIGPDTSLLLAEILLAAVDGRLRHLSRRRRLPRGFRYVDDYELGFATRAEAEDTLFALQAALGEYELEINAEKTRIAEGPLELEAEWVRRLRERSIRKRQDTQEQDLVSYFSLAFEFYARFPEAHVIQYALGRLAYESLHPGNWALVQALLVHCMQVDSSTVPLVVQALARNAAAGREIDRRLLDEGINAVIQRHAPLGQGSEVAWALWGLLAFKTPLSRKSAAAVVTVDDAVVALLALHAESLGLVEGLDKQRWLAKAEAEELYGSSWLLAYEAPVRGWLPSEHDHVAADPFFGYLRRAGVHFYDADAAALTAAPPAQAAPEPEAAEGY